MNEPLPWLAWTGLHVSPWKLIGLTGALMFGGRWFVQFIASRRHGKPVIPRVFWYMSMVGSLMTLAYFMFGKNDSVGDPAEPVPGLHGRLQPVPGHQAPRLAPGPGRALRAAEWPRLARPAGEARAN